MENRPSGKHASLWGNLDESKRVAQEATEAERIAREKKTRELREKRMALEASSTPKNAGHS
jgi:hypothetical protein